MGEFLDWTEMSLSGDLNMLNGDIEDISDNLYHLAWEDGNDEMYSIKDYPTVKNPLESNSVDVPEGTIRYVVDKKDDKNWHIRLEAAGSAFTWVVNPESERLEFTPLGATPDVMLHCEFHTETDERLSIGYIEDTGDAEVSEVLEFIVEELS